MSLRRHALLLAATLPAGGACSGPPMPAEGNQIGATGTASAASERNPPAMASTASRLAPAPIMVAEVDFLGRWVGVEGMILTVASRPGGGVGIDNQWDLDHRGSFTGTVTAAGLRWSRNGETVTAVRSNGDATGLRYLAGKPDCLTVRPGEGYCRS